MAKQQPNLTVPFAFPIKGKDDNWARQSQPPLTTADCLNVVPYDRLQRARGARRPGLKRLFDGPVGGAEALYRQARRCSDGGLASVYVAVAEIGVYPFYFRWNGDGVCYKVLNTEPAIPNPQFPVAAQRTAIVDCNDALCLGAPPGNPPKYRLTRKCSDLTHFAPLWFDASWASVYPFYFRFDGDGQCYKVLDTDPLLDAAGPTAVNRTPVVDCADAACACVSGSCGDFTSQIGPLSEHVRGGSPNFINRSAAGVVCTTGVATKIVFVAQSDDLVVLVHADDAGEITQTYSGVAGSAVTINIPSDAIIFRDTQGWMLSQAESLGPATVAKTLTNGTNSYTWPAGTSGNHGTGHVVDCQAGGFATRTWDSGVTIAELASRGWIDPDGYFRFRFALIPSGSGFLQISDLDCAQPTYRQLRLCSTNALSGLWVAVAEVTTNPFTVVVNAPPGGTAVSTGYYIDFADAPSATPGTLVGGYTVVPEGCNGGLGVPGNQYRRVRRCSDGVATGQIVKADTIGVGLPATFRRAGESLCMQIVPTDAPVAASAGTIITYQNPTAGCADAACAVSDTPCGSCSDSTPGRLNVVFSGVSLCTDCVNQALTGHAMNPQKMIGSLTNYCPTQNAGSPCTWTDGMAAAPLTLRVWQAPTHSDCSHPSDFQNFSDFQVVVTRSGTTWRVLVSSAATGLVIFDGTTTAALCATGVTINNSIAADCDVSPEYRMGGGGQCTLVLAVC